MAEMAELVSRAGVVKGNMRLEKGFFSCLCSLPALLCMRDLNQHDELALVSRKCTWLDSHAFCVGHSVRVEYGLPDRG